MPGTIIFNKIQILESPFPVFVFPNHNLQLHVISFAQYIKEDLNENFFAELSHSYAYRQTIHLWEDQWHTAKNIIKNRLLSKLGMSKRIHGRKTEVRRIDKTIAQHFLKVQHLQGYSTGYYKYGLYEKDILYAVALFSKTRKMRQEHYRSSELIRYANLEGYHVSGGLGKLINHYINELQPNDIMTYVDCDWGNGDGYKKIGFETKEITFPQIFWVNPETYERHSPSKFYKENGFDFSVSKSIVLSRYGLIEIYNSGNIKMIKNC